MNYNQRSCILFKALLIQNLSKPGSYIIKANVSSSLTRMFHRQSIISRFTLHILEPIKLTELKFHWSLKQEFLKKTWHIRFRWSQVPAVWLKIFWKKVYPIPTSLSSSTQKLQTRVTSYHLIITPRNLIVTMNRLRFVQYNIEEFLDRVSIISYAMKCELKITKRSQNILKICWSKSKLLARCRFATASRLFDQPSRRCTMVWAEFFNLMAKKPEKNRPRADKNNLFAEVFPGQSFKPPEKSPKIFKYIDS